MRGKARRGRKRLLADSARQLPHERGHVGPRTDLGDQLLDLALGQVRRTTEERVAVLPRQVRRQLGDAAEVQAAVGEHREQDWMLARGARRHDPQVGFRLREMEDVDAVAEHRRRRRARIEASPIHLADVGDDVGLSATGVAQELGEATKQRVVRNGGEWLMHGQRVGHILDRMGPRANKTCEDKPSVDCV
jgi:hypothetical protein